MRFRSVIAAPVFVSVGISCVGLAALAPDPALGDASAFFTSLVARYRGLTDYQDSVKLEQRTVERAAPTQAAPIERSIDCAVHDGKLALRTSDVRTEIVRSAAPWSAECDSRDGSPLSRMRLAGHLWTLPHLSLRFADEPLRSMQGAGGTLVPMTLESVTVGTKELFRLHLVSKQDDSASRSAEPAARDATVDLFVNPRSMLIERIEHSREIADGVRYEATIQISPERAVPAPGAEPVDATKPGPEPIVPGARPPEEDAPVLAPKPAPETEPSAAPTIAPSASPAPSALPSGDEPTSHPRPALPSSQAGG